jgi:hypothetical protein
MRTTLTHFTQKGRWARGKLQARCRPWQIKVERTLSGTGFDYQVLDGIDGSHPSLMS